jgi:signal transduction histidine kinase
MSQDQHPSAPEDAPDSLAQSAAVHAPEAIVACDAAGIVRWANAAALAWAENDPTGRALGEAYAIRLESGSLADILCQAAEGKPVRHLPARLASPASEVDVLVSANAVPEPFGGCVLTIADVSSRRPALHEVRTENRHQERRLQELTEQLAASNRELEAFCYSVSHDLRAPLRSLMSASMILREDFGDSLPADAADELQKITRASKRMAQLIDDLLKFSRLGRQEMHPKSTDLSAIASEIAEEYRRLPGHGHIDFQIEPGLEAHVDPILMRIALDNLIGNAVKFSIGRADARIEVRREDSVLIVADNGIGFEPQVAERIFLPFERLHPESEYPGTGIGLANVHRIVARHGGRVWGEGRPGAGATFYISLPDPSTPG